MGNIGIILRLLGVLKQIVVSAKSLPLTLPSPGTRTLNERTSSQIVSPQTTQMEASNVGFRGLGGGGGGFGDWGAERSALV